MAFDPITPFRLGGAPLWHIPIPSQRYITGDHPSSIHGFGEEIAEIREMEPGDSSEWYSPILSARMKKRMAVYHTRNEEVGVQFYLDAGPAIDFGVPSKRFVAVKIMSSLAVNLFREPNHGTAACIGVGSRIMYISDLADQAVTSSALRRLVYKCERYEHEDYERLPRVLKLHSAETPEQLICLFSDFLIPPQDEAAWGQLENACRRVEREGNEVIFIRVLSPLENQFPNVAITVRGAEHSLWSGSGTQKQILRTQSMIRERLNAICKKPDIRFLEIVWNDDKDATAFELQEFLKRRSCYIRAHLDIATA
ncbi:MAG: hypothetical protein G01um101448_11 [Parcubacteria group bacterium Gr01-1014_48]|nr:MAG: hypothetical protein Greene041614_373 [Parcubacteria group bacterium Greene0416_14]TSC74596.1 MAG: hypothetical protein G01um101448_11 [Parcubacteria group bacterium Gr01-1014_48]TSD01605.1 MAG: hypothetical protein Greene101415_185 [Parcubacteria group bacterium Greene1014_15]TSD08346.1 MAG: hypothetical protein Greene07144_141 [Parcubacteria group bacterium Greene0714_4]